MAKKKKVTAAKNYPRKSGGTIMISARLDPLTRYALELTSRAQRRGLSDVITWAIDQVADQTPVPGRESDGDTIKDLAKHSWSPNEIERIIQLGMFCPELLDFEESNIWRVIRETPELWHESIARNSVLTLGKFKWERLERQMAEVENMVREKAEQSPVTGLTAEQVVELGWELDRNRDTNDIPF